MKLSVVIPCYNEVQTLETILKKVKSASYPVDEIIIVDDYSMDGSRELLKEKIEKQPKVKVVYHSKNKGKGAALRSGFKEATKDIVLIQDADLEYNPQEYQKLLNPILSQRADVVFGSRFTGQSQRVLYFWHRIANGLLTLMSNMLTNINLTDMETCYKVFRREIIQSIKLRENRFGIEPEMTAKVAKIKECRIYEVGISYDGRTYEQGKKIGFKDAIRAVYCIIRYHFFN